MTPFGEEDIFVVKLNKKGEFQWAKQFGGKSYDRGLAIAVDQNGSVYITGTFFWTADFDPGPNIYNLTSKASEDIFITKLDKNGNFVWAKSFVGKGYDVAWGISLDNNENIYLTGNFSDSTDFDPDNGTFYLVPEKSNENDAFVAKFDSSCSLKWAKRIGSGLGYQFGYSVSPDASGNVIATGTFYDTTDFDPGINTFKISSIGSYDIFILKLNQNGDFVWAKTFGGIKMDVGYSVKTE